MENAVVPRKRYTGNTLIDRNLDGLERTYGVVYESSLGQIEKKVSIRFDATKNLVRLDWYWDRMQNSQLKFIAQQPTFIFVRWRNRSAGLVEGYSEKIGALTLEEISGHCPVWHLCSPRLA